MTKAPVQRALALVLLVAGTGMHSQDSLASQENDIQLTNKTQFFQVIGIKKSGTHISLKLKNSYEKSIIDFKIALPRPLGESGRAIDFVGDTHVIAPGETYEYSFTLPTSHLDSQNAVQQERKVVILTVLFDDRTSDGDAETAAEMVAERLGERLQLSRILPLLQNVFDLPDADLQGGLERLKAQVAALSLNPREAPEAIEILSSKYAGVFERRKDELIGEIGTGLYFGQGKFLVRIRDLERQLSGKGSASLREELNIVKKEYKKKLATL